jgi:2'-5' RNA ligase
MEVMRFPREKRSFSPHITLARVKDTALDDRTTALIENACTLGYRCKFPINVKTISFMRSELLRSGPVYSRLAEIGLMHN